VIEDTMIMGLDSYESEEEMASIRAAGGVPLGIGERWAARAGRLAGMCGWRAGCVAGSGRLLPRRRAAGGLCTRRPGRRVQQRSARTHRAHRLLPPPPSRCVIKNAIVDKNARIGNDVQARRSRLLAPDDDDDGCCC
jgi:hypothetical protein